MYVVIYIIMLATFINRHLCRGCTRAHDDMSIAASCGGRRGGQRRRFFTSMSERKKKKNRNDPSRSCHVRARPSRVRPVYFQSNNVFREQIPGLQ